MKSNENNKVGSQLPKLEVSIIEYYRLAVSVTNTLFSLLLQGDFDGAIDLIGRFKDCYHNDLMIIETKTNNQQEHK